MPDITASYHFFGGGFTITSHEDEVESDVGDWSWNSSMLYVSKLQENHNLYSDGWKDMGQ
jgi:hypothetical protein